MTFLAIQQTAFRRLKFADSPDSSVSTRIKDAINQWHRNTLVVPGIGNKLRRVQIARATTASRASYGVPFSKILHITERSNDRRLIKRSLDWYRTAFADPTQHEGTPLWWVQEGQTRIERPPADASELFIKSTSASDTGTAYVEVIRSGGYRRSLSVVMTGTTAVSLGAAITDVVDIVDFFISAAAVGTITLHEDSGTGTELARIAIGELYPRYLQVAFAPTPSAAITYFIDGIPDTVDMSVSTDEPLLPRDFHDLLVDGAVYEEWLSDGKVREAGILRGQIEEKTRRLRGWLWQQSEQDYDEGRLIRQEDEFTLPIT